MRKATVAATAAALLTAAVAGGVPGAAARGPGPQASGAASKCDTKCRNKRVTKFIAGHSFTFDTGFDPGSGHRTFERYDHCKNGTFSFLGDYIGFQGRSQMTFDGTWRVQSSRIIASRNVVKMPFTTQNVLATVIEGEPRLKGAPAASGVNSLVVTGAGWKFSFEEDDNILYRRGPGTC